MPVLIQDRTIAGRDLAHAMLRYRKQPDVIVLAVSRGGVAVGIEVARVLHAPLDIVAVRKLVVPGHPELSMGAIASGGGRVVNQEIVAALGISAEAVARTIASEQAEIDRRLAEYRGERPQPHVAGKRVILVDDGITTGSTMRAAIASVRGAGPAKVIVAVPVAPFHTLNEVRREVDEVVCLATPESVSSIGDNDWSFPRLNDTQVKQALAAHWREHCG